MRKILSAISNRPTKFVLASSLAALLYICGHSEVHANSAGQLQLESAEYSVTEGDAFVTLSVSRMYGASGTVSVPYYVGGGTATEGVDYRAASGELTFGDGETFKTIEIPIIDDHEIENTEGFGLSLGYPSGGAGLGYTTSAGVTIYDNDTPQPRKPGTLTFSHYVAGARENEGSVTLTVKRIDGSDGEVSVNYTTMNGNAMNSEDFETRYGTLTFANGETSKTITIPIYDDMDAEEDEYFQVWLSQPTNGAVLGANKIVDITIYDNDQWNPDPWY